MKNSKKGFTLVELIIVIAVIGVLAAILIPVFSNVIEKANAKSALSDAKNALQIAIAEMTDETGIIPIGEGSIFKVRKANKDWYFTYFNNGLHEGDGSENADIHYADFEKPENCTVMMNENSEYSDEMDYDTMILNVLPESVIIYNTGDSGSYTPPADLNVVIPITEADQLTTEFFQANGFNRKYRLDENITLSGEFEPITGKFKGSFDGNGKTISGLNINKPSESNLGLFTELENATVKDLTLNVGTISGYSYVGAVCSKSTSSTFTNIHVNISGEIKVERQSYEFIDQWMVGGLCGSFESGTISRCSAVGNVSGVGYVGGIAGFLGGSNISESYYKGKLSFTINQTGGRLGGITGEILNSEVNDCYTNITIDANENDVFGGIAGQITDFSKIKNCLSICTSVENAKEHTLAGAIAGHQQGEKYTVENAYYLDTNPITQIKSNSSGNFGTEISSYSEATGLSTSIWSFAGEYPTLINNPE